MQSSTLTGGAKPEAMLDLLPPVDRWPREIRNPGVMRSLTELRKVVNAIVREHGKPFQIRIELARDLRRTKAEREKAWKKSRDNQREREKIRKRIADEIGLQQPSRDDIRKVQLAEECQFNCPYTNRPIPMTELVGRESQFDIEHIIPFSRSLDDSFANLTLCYHEENRNVKGNRTPREAYGGTERWGEILDRVKRFRGEFAREKLRRFQMTTEEVEEHLKEFTSRQLNDTRYATKLAGDYLALLYGGRNADGKQRICATAGQVTAFLRNAWDLNGILGDGSTANGGAKLKTREDHRHHAVDAIVTALTDNATIMALSRSAEDAALKGKRRRAKLSEPWDHFVDSVREQIAGIVVSHRAGKKVSGALHEETFYGMGPRGAENGVRKIRKRLESLSKPEVAEIVDEAVRKRVVARLEELGKESPADAFSDPANLPYMESADGLHTPIKSVRIHKKLPTFPIGSGRGARQVASDSNHHVEIFAELDEKGREVEWDGHVVPLAEAYRRMRNREAVVRRDFGPNRRFIFSLSPGEVVECKMDGGKRGLFVVRKMSEYSTGNIAIGFAPISDARQAKVMQAAKAWLWSGPNTLCKRNARKVVIGPLGEVSEAHD